jgi:hypothetical protein
MKTLAMHAGKNEAAANRQLTEPDWPSASLFRLSLFNLNSRGRDQYLL